MNEGMENLKQIAELEERAMDMKAIKDAAIIEQLRMNAAASIRIADAIEEIMRLVKKDMAEMKKAAK